jgi:hypothetical protein
LLERHIRSLLYKMWPAWTRKCRCRWPLWLNSLSHMKHW